MKTMSFLLLALSLVFTCSAMAMVEIQEYIWAMMLAILAVNNFTASAVSILLVELKKDNSSSSP